MDAGRYDLERPYPENHRQLTVPAAEDGNGAVRSDATAASARNRVHLRVSAATIIARRGVMPEESAAPSATDPAPELAEEAQIGGTPAGRAANAALRAISRTARSFLLYDPHNDAIRASLEDLRAKMAEALRVAGTLALEVRPFELVSEDEVVYLERDRERSLAFRMYRDGVRRLTVHPEIEWDEILRLLEVLSVRYAGVRQNEDDVVTLLWKAGLQHVELDAVEGFVPEEEDAVPGAPTLADAPRCAPRCRTTGTCRRARSTRRRRASRARCPRRRRNACAPRRRRTPCPRTRCARWSRCSRPSRTRPIPPRSRTSPASSARCATSCWRTASSRTSRDLVRALGDESKLAPAQAAPVLATFADKRAIGRILRSVPKGVETAPAELVALLDLLPADHLTHLIDLLGEERSEASRRCARSLIERYAPKRPDELVSPPAQRRARGRPRSAPGLRARAAGPRDRDRARAGAPSRRRRRRSRRSGS